MDFREAKKLAEGAIARSQRLTAAFEGTRHWFFSVGDSFVDVVPDCSPIAIDKSTGETSYPIPSVPSILTGEAPTDAEIEIRQAQEVALS